MENIIELFFSLGLFINAMLFIPQIMRVFKSKSAKEISFITFFGFLLIQFSAVLHGVIRQDHVLVFGTLLSMVSCGSLVFLIVYYRFKQKKED